MATGTNCSDLGAQENKISHCFIVSPSICHEVMGLDCQGPAPADPGSSKRGRRRRGSGYNSFN